MRIRLSPLLLPFCFAAQVHAQASESTHADVNPPQKALLTFSTPQSTSLGGPGTSMTGLVACSPDGVAFFLALENSGTDSQQLALHSLNRKGESTVFAPTGVYGYRNIGSPTRFFVSDRTVAMLTEAQKNPGPTSPADNAYYPLALLYTRDGTFQTAIAPPQGFEASGVGVFDSGNVLLIGMDKDKRTQFHVFSPDGTLTKSFTLFDEDFNKGPGREAKQPMRDLLPSGALAFVQLTAYGHNLLINPQTTSEPILEVSESGLVRSTFVKLPANMTLDQLLDASGNSWLFKTFVNLKKDPPTMPAGPIIQVNSQDGTIEKVISLPPNSEAHVLCEANGDFLAYIIDPKTWKVEVQTASFAP